MKTKWVLITFNVEEIEWRLLSVELIDFTNVHGLSKDWRCNLEMFFTFDDADELFFHYLLWSPLKISPISKGRLLLSQQFAEQILFNIHTDIRCQHLVLDEIQPCVLVHLFFSFYEFGKLSELLLALSNALCEVLALMDLQLCVVDPTDTVAKIGLKLFNQVLVDIFAFLKIFDQWPVLGFFLENDWKRF